MKNILFLAIIVSFSCTKQFSDAGSQVYAGPATTPYPKPGNHIGVYGFSSSSGRIAFMPAVRVKDGKVEVVFNRYEFKNGKPLFVNRDLYKGIGQSDYKSDKFKFYPINENGANNTKAIQELSWHLSRTGIVGPGTAEAWTRSCERLYGQSDYDDASFETNTPAVGDGVYILAPIRKTNPLAGLMKQSGLSKQDPYQPADLVNFTVGAIVANENGSILLSATVQDIRNFALDESRLQGLPVFSKKTDKILGFIDVYLEKDKALQGELVIKSIFSKDIQDAETLTQRALIPKPKSRVETEAGDQWKNTFCSPKAVAQIMARKRPPQGSVSNSPNSPTSPNVLPPPWAAGCSVSQEAVLKDLARLVAAQDQAHATEAARPQKTNEKITPPWDYVSSQEVP